MKYAGPQGVRMSVSLSPALLHDLIGVHLGKGVEPHANRRVAARIAFQQRAKVFPLIGRTIGEAVAIDVRDLSSNGVGFRARRRFAADDRLVLSLAANSGNHV